MSWLPIGAVILVCRTCDWSLQVDIDNKGHIQIGDDNIAFLLRMNQDRDKISMDTPVPEGFFGSYHTMPVGCTCQECYIHQEGATEQAKTDLVVQQIFDCSNKITEIHSSFKSRQRDTKTFIMENWLEGINFEWAQRIDEKVYMRTLGHAQFGKTDQRTRLINQFVAEGKSSIIQSAMDHFNERHEIQVMQDEYGHMVEPWFQQICLLIDNVHIRQRDPIVRAYEHFDKTKPINLNNHIRYEGTLAYPLDSCHEYHVYMPIQYNLNQGDQWLQDHRIIGDSMPKEKAIVNTVRKILLSMVSNN